MLISISVGDSTCGTQNVVLFNEVLWRGLRPNLAQFWAWKRSFSRKHAQNARFQFNPYPETPVSACFGWDQIWGSFQKLELRRARDQLVFNKTPHPPPTASLYMSCPSRLCKKYLMWGLVPVYKNAEWSLTCLLCSGGQKQSFYF